MRPSEQIPPARPAAPDGASRTPVNIPSGAYVGVTLVALLMGAAGIVRGTRDVKSALDSDLTTFFFPAADQILHGHPWMIYAVRAFGGYPNYNPPVSIFLMAPLLALARAVGFAANLGEQITFVSIPFMAFVVLLAYATVVALRRLFPAIPETQRFLAFVLVLFSPLTWQTFTIWYHLEQPLMLALLVGAIVLFQQRREGLAGVLAGLAVLTRTTAIVPLIAFGVLLLAERRWRALISFGGVAALTAGVGFAPFFLFDRRDSTYSLVSWRGSAEIGGNSIWAILKYDGSRAESPLRYALDHVARRLDMYTVILFVVVIAFLAARRLRVSAYAREAWAVLAVAALAVPMLSKNNWPYYFLEPFLFLLIWEFASMHDRRSGVWRWPLLTFGYLSVAATLSQFIGLQSVGYFDRVAVGLLDFGTMLAFAVAVWLRALAGRSEHVVAPAEAGPPGAQPAPGFALGGPDAWARQPGGAAWPGAAQSAANMPGAPRQARPGGPADASAQPAAWPGASSGGHAGWNAAPVRPPEGWRPAGSPPAPGQPWVSQAQDGHPPAGPSAPSPSAYFPGQPAAGVPGSPHLPGPAEAAGEQWPGQRPAPPRAPRGPDRGGT
jgi:hypothetical protein